MTTNPPEVKLCMHCRYYDGSNSCIHESNMKMSFVDGKMRTFNTIHFLREFDSRPSDKVQLCGPSGQFHERAQILIDYAEKMIRRDIERRHTGTTEQDLDIACRKLQGGS